MSFNKLGDETNDPISTLVTPGGFAMRLRSSRPSLDHSVTCKTKNGFCSILSCEIIIRENKELYEYELDKEFKDDSLEIYLLRLRVVYVQLDDGWGIYRSSVLFTETAHSSV